MKNDNIYKIIDLYEPVDLDADKLLDILVKEGIGLTKDEFEDVLENYFMGVSYD